MKAQHLLFCAAACASITLDASAQTPAWPTRPLRIIAAQSPGGVTDMLARTLAQKFSEAWKQPAVVENRAGASGQIGMELLKNSPADGYTIGIGQGGNLVVGLAVE